MKIAKPTDQDKELFRALFEDRPELQLKPMFGNLAAFVAENSQMCAGLFGSLIGLRLGEADREELSAVDGSGPFGPQERPMKEYVAIPEGWRTGGGEVEAWIDKAVAHTLALPPKKKRKSR